MKLALVTGEFPPGPGGVGTHAYQVSSHLARAGWGVTVMAPQAYASEEEIQAFNATLPFDLVRLETGGHSLTVAARRLRTMRRTLERVRPDLVVGTGDRANYLTSVVAAACRVPWVAIEHGRRPRGWEGKVKRQTFPRAEAIICVSHYTEASLRDYGVTPKRSVVIHNGADDTAFHPAPVADQKTWLAKLGIPADKPLLVTLGHVTPRKGQDLVVRAIHRMPDVHYACIGIPTHGDELRSLAASLGIGGRLHLTGRLPQDAVRALLTHADLFAMTSRHALDGFEGFGIAAVEAALCGTPAVVSGDSGLAEAVIDGETGLVVSAEDVDATAAAIGRLLGDRALLKQLGARARARATTSGTWAQAVARYDELLRSVAGKTP